MKIIDILTYPVNLAGNHVFVKVLTDEHLYGIGEAYRVGPDAAVRRAIWFSSRSNMQTGGSKSQTLRGWE